eukprot:7077665-Prymnesium_polylepis.1
MGSRRAGGTRLVRGGQNQYERRAAGSLHRRDRITPKFGPFDPRSHASLRQDQDDGPRRLVVLVDRR